MKTRLSFIALIALMMNLLIVTPSIATERHTNRLNCVTGEELTRNGDTDLMRALRGRIAGLNIIARSTNSNAGFDVNMRGNSSISCSQELLYVVDGM